MKRTTETVLRAELAAKAKEIEKAMERRDRADQATRDAHAAGVVAQQGVDHAIAARDRARAALEAYLPGNTLGMLVDQAKERAETTGTHDPADLRQIPSTAYHELKADILPAGYSVETQQIEGGALSASAGDLPTELAAARRGPRRKADTVVDEGDEAP